jgi:hypothetical protein
MDEGKIQMKSLPDELRILADHIERNADVVHFQFNHTLGDPTAMSLDANGKPVTDYELKLTLAIVYRPKTV